MVWICWATTDNTPSSILHFTLYISFLEADNTDNTERISVFAITHYGAKKNLEEKEEFCFSFDPIKDHQRKKTVRHLLNSSKQAQAPDWARPLKNFPMAW